MSVPRRIKSISEFHKLRNLPEPEHPLVSVVDYRLIQHDSSYDWDSLILDFYSISLKRMSNAKIRYGQQVYDFDEGVLFFMAPNQVFSITKSSDAAMQHAGWLLLFHPDFLWNTSLAKAIKKYDFFDYAVNEALFLSAKEESTLNGIIQNIEQEYQTNIDKFSQPIIISQIETLLNYADRFYQRQFITRQVSNHQILDRLERLLADYFDDGDLMHKGLPTVKYISDSLHVSPTYLRNLLQLLTGQSTQWHIHHKVIEIAKEQLSTTDRSVSEIAYNLGFEHPQSFSKLFKSKTNLTPLAFRASFNGWS
ncbi:MULTISPECIES: helix-turn-helix domain-containing protein [Olivibacter]|uniref:Helix-turn-helix domain-containing protein n=1 Tax=Olivibacter oleidegradans TaxID=760123 RepID=A0ABV6HMH4_9SPHI|nr:MULTISPECIES: helix-turn-helix transcriptional regulator [Olivibacter]MDM8173061.1 helix-turn-helix transcriptional regulator [Olivibacter sp. 47]QEL02846.1 helix-turn-helix transcriptional regulator [Olivibacter sp. LS-1]